MLLLDLTLRARCAVLTHRWYAIYVEAVKDLPIHRLKYLDESHFASRGSLPLAAYVCLMLW